MAGKDIIAMSLREVKRLKVIQEAVDRHITQKTAASMTGLSERQVRRLVKVVKEEGDIGIIHKARGKTSTRKTPEELRERTLNLYKRRYNGFGPTLASEKLAELDGILVSKETLRKWLIEVGLWKKKRKATYHRQWRPRRECFGEMIQMDGSHHDWLEGRGPEMVLMGYIDDATNNVFGRFYDYEGTMPAMESFRLYVKKYGLPISVYLDRHTTYKSSKKLTEWEELEGLEPMSQFERALKELGVEVIHAYSPQAKGRVERLFGILQDRLVKEMRLRGIKTKEEANAFLKEYLPLYNRKFRMSPANKTDAHVKLPGHFNLDNYLCIKTERTVRNDNTIAYNGSRYQIEEEASEKVIVQERLDGSMRVTCKGLRLRYREIAEEPKKKPAKSVDRRKFRRPSTPAKNHPWKRWNHKFVGKGGISRYGSV